MVIVPVVDKGPVAVVIVLDVHIGPVDVVLFAGCIDNLSRFSGISAISQLGSRR